MLVPTCSTSTHTAAFQGQEIVRQSYGTVKTNETTLTDAASMEAGVQVPSPLAASFTGTSQGDIDDIEQGSGKYSPPPTSLLGRSCSSCYCNTGAWGLVSLLGTWLLGAPPAKPQLRRRRRMTAGGQALLSSAGLLMPLTNLLWNQTRFCRLGSLWQYISSPSG